jgi:hypothetical protein
MHSILRSARKLILPAMAAMALLQAESHAVIIKVFGPLESANFAEMRAVAEALRDQWHAGGAEAVQNGTSTGIHGFRYEVAEGPVVPLSLSMTPGTAAYFWSDEGFRYERGFSFKGGRTAFGKPPGVRTGLGKKEGTAKAEGLLWTTGLKTASVNGSQVLLNYSLAKAAPVSLEIFAADGKVFKRWNWRDAEPGAYNKAFEIGRLPKSGTFFLRWTSGQNRVVKRLTIIR